MTPRMTPVPEAASSASADSRSAAADRIDELFAEKEHAHAKRRIIVSLLLRLLVYS